ncbi:hypothetical protein B9Z55_013352 [Caenorhabditis nigoni]|uniref:Uncharacterized protein n=1 Tax=Caenorhabditis nigoni TaxID=1611254 RepID=A0A2G5U1U1_9PELO|nr:hypothetical protein B9Z55_013352 [Caenorhabditis nigoni]
MLGIRSESERSISSLDSWIQLKSSFQEQGLAGCFRCGGREPRCTVYTRTCSYESSNKKYPGDGDIFQEDTNAVWMSEIFFELHCIFVIVFLFDFLARFFACFLVASRFLGCLLINTSGTSWTTLTCKISDSRIMELELLDF